MSGPEVVTVGPIGPLRGRLRPPGDKSISHRALLLAARARGTSLLRHLATGADVVRTARAVHALGADVINVAAEGNLWQARVLGGPGALHEPDSVLDLGNSGTGIRLLAGFVAPNPWLCVLTGDDSVRRRPMDRVVEPLREMGATIDGRSGGALAPLVVRGGSLHGIEYEPPVASAQVKSAVLLAALGAEGTTSVHEPVPTRTHTEELLRIAGGRVEVERDAEGPGATVRLTGGELHSFELDIASDPSAAAFVVVAACLVAGSEVVCEGVYTGPGRSGFLGVLERMGAVVERHHRGGSTADIVARHGPLAATEVGGEEVPGLIDEVPVLAVAAALAEGTTTFRDVGELRVKESDRVESVAAMIRALGGEVEVGPDWLTVRGGRLAGGCRVDAAGDHRVAMAAAVAGLACPAPVEIAGWESVRTSWPGFLDELATLR